MAAKRRAHPARAGRAGGHAEDRRPEASAGRKRGELLALGVSHKTAPLELRERVALTEGRAAGVLRELVEAPTSPGGRRDLDLQPHRALPGDAGPGRRRGAGAGSAGWGGGIQPTELVGHLYSVRSADAALHLFRVTAGLDSMIVGEAEVQGQVKRAYELALVEGATGPLLNRLFRGALTAGKRARSETGITEHGVSVPSVAVELARRTLGDLASRRVARGRRRRDGGAHRPRARRAWGGAGVHRQPPLRPSDRPRPAVRRAGDPVRGAARADGERRHCRRLDELPASRHRARRARPGHERPSRAPAAPDRPRGAARRPPGLPRPGGGRPLRHGRPADARRAERLRPRGGGTASREHPPRRARPASSAGSARRTSSRRSRRCAPARTRSPRACSPRTSSAGSR